MARGRHYAKLSLSNAARLSFSDLCILLFMFLSLCRLCVCVFLCSHWSLVDVPLIFFCPADHVPDWQPRVLLGMVEARSVNVKKTTTTTTTFSDLVANPKKLLYTVANPARGLLNRENRTKEISVEHSKVMILCVCVCVFFPFILDIKFVGRTSRGHTGGRSHRISHPPSFCGACLDFSREKNSAIPFPRRP